jgi:hypothetical protein
LGKSFALEAKPTTDFAGERLGIASTGAEVTAWELK